MRFRNRPRASVTPGAARGPERGALLNRYESCTGSNSSTPPSTSGLFGDLASPSSRRPTRVLYRGFEATCVD